MLRPEKLSGGSSDHASSYVRGCIAARLVRTADTCAGAQEARRLHVQRQHAERSGVRRLPQRDRHRGRARGGGVGRGHAPPAGREGATAGRHRLGCEPLALADQQGDVRALRFQEPRRHAGRIPRPGQSVDRQQSAPAGDPAEHQDRTRGRGSQELGRPARSQMEGQDRLRRSGQLRLGLRHRHHAGRSVGRRRGGLEEGRQPVQEHEGAQPLLPGLPGRRQRASIRWASRWNMPGRCGPRAARRSR